MTFPLKKGNKEKDIMKEIAGDYLIKQTIGEGTFSKVKLGVNMFTGQKVAIKILDKVKIIEEVGIERVLREIKISSELNHPNIIKIHKILEDDKYYLVVMEYCEEGELFNYIVKKDRLSEKESSFFYYQIINAIEYLHSKGIAHRDLKPENILLGDNHIIKLIDFGLSNYYFKDKLLITPCGSPSYASPEMVRGEEYNGANNDIWATGIILFAMLCGYLPFENEDNAKDNELLFKKILEGKIDYPNYLSDMAIDLLKKLLVNNPEKRIKINEIKQHKFYLKGKQIFEKKQESLPFNELKLQNNNNQNENYIIDNKKNNYTDKFLKINFTKNNHEENNKSINIFKKKYSDAKQEILAKFKNNISLTSKKNRPKIITNNNLNLAIDSNMKKLNTDILIPTNEKMIKPLNGNQNLKYTFNTSNKNNELNEDLEKKIEDEKMKNITNHLTHKEINYYTNNLFSQLQRKKEKSMDYPHKLYINGRSLNTISNKEISIKSPNKKPLLQIKIFNSTKKKKSNLYENYLFYDDLINKNKSKIKMNDKLIINLTNSEENSNNKSMFRINRKLKKLDKKCNFNFNSPLKYQNIKLNTDITISGNFPYINSTRKTSMTSPKYEKLKPVKIERKYLFTNINKIINLKTKDIFKYFNNPKIDSQLFNGAKTNEKEQTSANNKL